MAPKRRARMAANQEGRIWQRASDGRYAMRVYPPGGGKVRHVYGATREEVKGRRDRLLEELSAGQPGGRAQTLNEYLDHWLARTLPQRVRAGKLAQSTLNSYADTIRLHIRRDLGRVPMRDLNAPRLREWVEDLSRKRSSRTRRKPAEGEKRLPPAPLLSERTVAYCYAVLHKALEDAVADSSWGITANPLSKVDAPAGRRRKVSAPTYEEAAALFRACQDDRLWCFWVVVLGLGLRRGEALGLRWDDFDMDAKTLLVQRQIQRVRDGSGRSGLVAKTLKTQASRATIAVPDLILGLLEAHRRQQRAERMRSPVWHDEANLVFTTSIGTALEPRNINRSWQSVCDRAGTRPLTPHDLRHAWGTWLANEGVPQKVIQSGLRHARLATTDGYVHPMDEPSRRAANRMGELLEPLIPAARRLS